MFPWLKKKVRTKLKNIAVGIVALATWLFIITHVFTFLFGWEYSSYSQKHTLGLFVMSCVVAPLWEEAAYRHGPLKLAKQLKLNPYLVLMLSCFLFGWGHGNGSVSILIQGVGGFIIGLVYLENKYSYLSAITLHFLWNLTVIFLI